jgi:Ca-activated chloride channel family protein
MGMGNYNDVLMEQLADDGDGFYSYVDTMEQARRVFVDQLTSTLLTIARTPRFRSSSTRRRSSSIAWSAMRIAR